MTDAIQLANSLDFQISQLYPFPLAYSYRLLAGYVDSRELLQHQLRVAENILAFLGSISLAILNDSDRREVGGSIRSYWTRGISPGDWKDIIRRCSLQFKEYEGNPLTTSIQSLKAESEKRGFGKELSFLIKMKNDWKHDRAPTVETEVRSLSKNLQESLDSCMASLKFLTRHPIRQVEQLDIERRQTGRVHLKCRRITGDHPGFRQEKISWNEPLRKKDLFVEINDGYWLPLYPFIQIKTCSLCKTDEIYFVDKWDGKEKATLKSFERGHTSDSSETAKDLSFGMPASEEN